MNTFEELVEILNDKTASSYSKRNALSALGKLGDERVIDPLTSALQDEDRYVRSEAAKVFGELKITAAIDPLIQALGDPDDHVQQAVITALGLVGDESAIEPLRQLEKDQSYFTRSEAEKSIKKIEERLKKPAPVEDIKPEPEPVPSPPAKVETEKETTSEHKDAGKKEPETPPPDEVPEATEMRKIKLSDDHQSELRSKISEHQAHQATKLANKIDQQQNAGNQSSSIFFDIVNEITTGTKKNKRFRNIIRMIVIVFFILVVITKGAILPPIIILVPLVIIIWMKSRKKDQTGSNNAMDLLIDGLSNNDPKIRAISARILGESGDGRAIDALWKAMKKEQDAEVKKAIEKALEKLG